MKGNSGELEKLKLELSRWINFDEVNSSMVPLVKEDNGKDLLGSEQEETHPKGTVQIASQRVRNSVTVQQE